MMVEELSQSCGEHAYATIVANSGRVGMLTDVYQRHCGTDRAIPRLFLQLSQIPDVD
jgi:hypothetical protein